MRGETYPESIQISMMMDAAGYSSTTKLPTPNQLPEQGLTAVQFKPWKNQMLTFLQQNPRNIVFLTAPPRPAEGIKTKEGIYQSWLPSAQYGLYSSALRHRL